MTISGAYIARVADGAGIMLGWPSSQVPPSFYRSMEKWGTLFHVALSDIGIERVVLM